MGWSDLSIVREEVDIKWDYRGNIREYFRESKVFRWTQEEVV